ncbi:WD repeat-containing protein 81 [Orchesella cincta]|uniref:WD repeat-containing protein 81 n=1 Tax=Orchesella cincta TaxID=48709 RepID=A0A1D2M5L1_ORCCI|nr:WD repeat-containing protein 81 [Orchesella cincta]
MNPFQSFGLNVPTKYLFSLASPVAGYVEKRFIVATHLSWIREVISERRIPKTFPVHERLTDDEVQAYLSQGKCLPLGPQWIFIVVTAVKFPKTLKYFRALENPCSIPQPGKMSWPQIIDFIGEVNFNYLWEQPQINLLPVPEDKYTSNDVYIDPQTPLVQMEESSYLSKLLRYLYINLEENPSDDDKSVGESRFPISNLCQALSVVTVPSFLVDGSDQQTEGSCHFIFHPYITHSLQDMMTFSPQKVLVSNAKQMFVVYQLLQFLRDCEAVKIPVGELNLSDIRVDECLYVNIIPSLHEIHSSLQVNGFHPRVPKMDPKIEKLVKFIVRKVKGWDISEPNSPSAQIGDNFAKITPQLVELVIRHWCEGLLSNYDYLMFLNFLSGRFCVGNPNFHPVFPWVTDFTQPQGGWRDLTKSKFRLNKGERQLDIMYEEIGANENTIAHHVTDILSEITFYVYKARRTPKEVLCKFVRPKWVPAEYPSSIQRMQEWTPDECIPEFYDDPTIFLSIHDDLPDLQIPRWCANPQDFIMQHRKLLESEFVSAKLHHWIDLTFGYKLSGVAAVKSKNIYLSLVDSHDNLESHGIVQLFQTPHPPRKNILRNFKNIVHFKELKKMREMEVDESQEPGGDAKAKVWKNINLPKHYDPMGFLNDFEVCMNFFRSHFPYLKKDPKVVLTGLKDRTKLPSLVKLFGCLLLELVLPKRLRHVCIVRTVEERFEFYQSVVKSSLNYVPLFCRRAVQAIFFPESLEFSIPLDISLDLLLLGDKIGPIPFPDYFGEIYKMIKGMRNYERILAVAAPEDIGLKVRLQELKVKSFSRDLIQVLPSLDEQGLEIVLPFVIEIFQNPETRVLAVWNIFLPFSQKIGRKKSIEFLLNPILQIYEADYHSEKHLKLFHRTFILQLCCCFGVKRFLDSFPTLLIEAIGGWKAPGDNEDLAPRAHLTSTDLEIDLIEDSEETSSDDKNKSKGIADKFRRMESEQGDAVIASVEPEMFLMEPDASDSEEKDGSTQGSGGDSLQQSLTALPTTSSSSIVPSHSHQLARSGSDRDRTRNQSPPALLRRSRELQKSTSSSRDASTGASSAGSKSVVDISEMCAETILWLAHRFGPVLCAKYLTKNLLRMLTLCFLGHIDNIEVEKRNCSMHCDGDLHAKKVLECLIVISDLYGDCFIEHQYLPYCLEVVSSGIRKLNVAIEAAILGVSALLEHIFNYVSDTFLVSQLKDPIISAILTPLCRMICSEDVVFPSGSGSVSILASKIVGMMSAIRKKIGQDLSKIHLKPLLSTITTAFDKVYSGENNVKPEFATIFGSALAFQLYSSLCDVISGHEHESLIRDLYLKQGLSDRSLSIKEDDASPSSGKVGSRLRIEQQSSFGSRSFGNRIQVHEGEGNEEGETVTVTKKDTSRHLRGNWLIYWDHEIGRAETKFNFKQIKLQTFVGHTAAVRCIHSLDNENSFLTAGKDKTVKLFSLRNQGDESMVMNCQWTYSNHKKAVLSVLFHEPLHIAASTDGIVHIWDPFMGKLIRRLERGSSKTNGPICCLRSIQNTSTIVGAGIDSSIAVVDVRTCHSYELKIGIGQASGLVRCMAVSDNGQVVAVGHSSGMLSTLDLRSGTLLGSWKGHDGEVLQLLCRRENQLISSSFDQSISVWNLDENRLAFNLRGPTEPVHSLCLHGTELISCTTSNRIGVHCGIDPNSDFSSTRLRSDAFKGIVTSMRHLPLNQFLLVGSDSGNVTLLC